MSGSSVASHLEELVKLLGVRCPVLCPAIFPSKYSPKELTDLCSSDYQQSKVKKWFAEKGAPSFRYETILDISNGLVCITALSEGDATDVLLGNLDATMHLLTQGTAEEVDVARTRFNHLNGHFGDKDLEHRKFVETYNIAYAIKVLISNMSFQLRLSRLAANKNKSHTAPSSDQLLPLPLEDGITWEPVLNNLFKRIIIDRNVNGNETRGVGKHDDSASDSEDDDIKDTKTKKRRKKRSSKSGK